MDVYEFDIKLDIDLSILFLAVYLVVGKCGHTSREGKTILASHLQVLE